MVGIKTVLSTIINFIRFNSLNILFLFILKLTFIFDFVNFYVFLCFLNKKINILISLTGTKFKCVLSAKKFERLLKNSRADQTELHDQLLRSVRPSSID